MPRSSPSLSFFAVFRMPDRMSSTPVVSGRAVLVVLHVEIVDDLGDLLDGLVLDAEGPHEHFEGAEIAHMGELARRAGRRLTALAAQGR